MTRLAYHGTTRRFDRFDLEATPVSGSPTRALGLFFSADARIAAHFTLRPAVLNEGYADEAGSRGVCNDPWAFDEDPFLPQARVVCVELRLHNPYPMTAMAFAQWVGQLPPSAAPEATVAAFRAGLEAQGHDGIEITPWDGQPLPGGGELCVEFDASTYVAFYPHQVRILSHQAAEAAWLDQ